MIEKARFGSSSSGLGANRPILVIWFALGIYTVFTPAGRVYDLFYPAMDLWFLEFLVIYLAVEGKFFRRVLSWMLFTVGFVFLSLYLSNWLMTESFDNIVNQKYRLKILSIWHFIACAISIASSEDLKSATKR